MDERIKLLLKKTRHYQFLAAVLAIVCLLVFLVFNFTLNEHSGAFKGHNHVNKEVTVPLDRKGLENLEIEADDVTLEVGMVSNLTEPVVRLAGKGYSNQFAKVDIEGTHCRIVLKGDHADAEGLTMQVLLPQSALSRVAIAGDDINLHVERLRTTALHTEINGGYGYLADVKAHDISVSALDAPVRLANNRATSVTIEGNDDSVTFMENAFEQVKTVTDEGGIFVYDKRVKGQWQLDSQDGDITMISKNLPYNLLIKAAADQDGAVKMGYKSRFWKDAHVVESTKTHYYGSVGNNPNKIIQCRTDNGQISIGQRERYSNLDPYAGDYPFADQNPYVVERSTKTK